MCASLCVQELVSEKLSVQQQSVELERLSEELEKIGLNREKLLQQEYAQEDRYLALLGADSQFWVWGNHSFFSEVTSVQPESSF